MRSRILFSVWVLVLAVMVLSGVASPVVYTVTNTDDSGSGSLRWAIEQANANQYWDEIHFNIPGPGPHTIQLISPLPVIVDPLFVDGYTQPGAVKNTNPVNQGFNTVLKIELDGSRAGDADGLWIDTHDCDIRGLAINRFSGNGIYMKADDTQIFGNFIGTDISGHTDLGNRVGITILGGQNCYIGSSLSESGNLISGNALDGIALGGGSYVLSRHTIQRNLVGTDVTGENAIGNGRHGIFLAATVESTVVGGTAADGNVIAFNGETGIAVGFGIMNTLIANSIHSNGALGIDLAPPEVTSNDSGDVDTGPNNLQNFPVLTEAAPTIIEGYLNSMPNSAYRIEFFVNGTCDSSGHGEGRTSLGHTTLWTYPDGNFSFAYASPVSLAPGKIITATATDMSGNTSEFSNCVTVTVCCECADCNADGDINILDALWEVNCILGTIPQPCSCDCNQDGNDNILDVLCVVNLILGGVCP